VRRALLSVWILATAAGCNGDDRENPRCKQLARLVVTLDDSTLFVGESTQARVIVYDSAGDTIGGCKVSWSVLPPPAGP